MPSTIWHNLDDHLQFDACLEHFKADQVRNFAVQFDAGHARCAVDVDQDVVEALLETDRTGEQSRTTHWLNFWSGARDAAAITSIAKKYGVPPRLASLLHTQRPPKPSQSARAPCSPRTDFASRMRSADIETGVAEVELSPKVAPQSRAPGFGDVIDSLWHFCSVDRGPQYIYVGFNAIFALPGVELENQNDFSKPFGVRIWTSLLLCSDGTVVSIYEQPPSHIPRDFINNMRSNVLNNLHHLSKHVMSASPNSLMHISVRPDLSSEQVSTEDSDSPALLFYYLFDDWATTYALITQQHNPYRERLRQIRQVMFDAADMDLIKSLDLVGRQLMALKLIYQSYDTTIRQILKHGGAEHRGSWDALSYASGPNMSYFQRSSQPSGLNLPPCTIDRFERLLDRIRLYALTEIDECLKQKESLVFMVCPARRSIRMCPLTSHFRTSIF